MIAEKAAVLETDNEQLSGTADPCVALAPPSSNRSHYEWAWT